MRNCNKIITVRLTDEEYNHCELMAKGNKSFYIRQLIRNDSTSNMNSDLLTKEAIIQIVENYLRKENAVPEPPTPIKPEHTRMAKQVISDLFNF
ncbi:hypothetical protein [Pelosinus sp. sgz500959]|uniref:hypothetical protein n=1 Tax=Pelosinus sp. sgz500959 TaxID=3242472 RepID=UPI00367131EF